MTTPGNNVVFLVSRVTMTSPWQNKTHWSKRRHIYSVHSVSSCSPALYITDDSAVGKHTVSTKQWDACFGYSSCAGCLKKVCTRLRLSHEANPKYCSRMSQKRLIEIAYNFTEACQITYCFIWYLIMLKSFQWFASGESWSHVHTFLRHPVYHIVSIYSRHVLRTTLYPYILGMYYVSMRQQYAPYLLWALNDLIQKVRSYKKKIP